MKILYAPPNLIHKTDPYFCSFMNQFMHKRSYAILAIIVLSACNHDSDKTTDKLPDTQQTDATPPTINYSVVNAYPHDTTAYTEGFLIHSNSLRITKRVKNMFLEEDISFRN